MPRPRYAHCRTHENGLETIFMHHPPLPTYLALDNPQNYAIIKVFRAGPSVLAPLVVVPQGPALNNQGGHFFMRSKKAKQTKHCEALKFYEAEYRIGTCQVRTNLRRVNGILMCRECRALLKDLESREAQ